MKKLLRKIARKILTRIDMTELGKEPGKGIDDKLNFEKDLVKLLDKYDIFKSNTQNILEKITIKAEVGQFPTVELKSLIYEHEEAVKI